MGRLVLQFVDGHVPVLGSYLERPLPSSAHQAGELRHLEHVLSLYERLKATSWSVRMVALTTTSTVGIDDPLSVIW